MGHERPVENRDRDLDREDVSPASAASPVGSIDTGRVRSNHRASCPGSLTLTLSPILASVPGLSMDGFLGSLDPVANDLAGENVHDGIEAIDDLAGTAQHRDV